MRNKKGFTLVEVLAVITILGVIALIAVPVYIVINNNMKNKLYETKVGSIETAAELYAADNKDDLFTTGDTEIITVGKLLNEKYLENEPECEEKHGTGKDICNPKDNTSMKDIQIEIEKANRNYTANIVDR